jgi:predicted ATP-binding protein involved in virulence
MQFIVTTHSPLVLAGCRAEEVWMLEQDQATGDVTARQGDVAPMLLTASEMYREYFGVSRSYASELGEALRQYIELASNPFRSDAEDDQVITLRKHLLDHRVDVDYQPVVRKSAS